jgi:hypothetical protein
LQSKESGRINPGQSAELQLVFTPPSDFVGIATATLHVNTRDESSVDVVLRGLSTKGLEGKNEAPLADVLTTLGVGTDLGWETFANHTKPQLQGEEIAPALFSKAGEGHVDIIPLARYSPSFRLPFGFYTSDGQLHRWAFYQHTNSRCPSTKRCTPSWKQALQSLTQEIRLGEFTRPVPRTMRFRKTPKIGR